MKFLSKFLAGEGVFDLENGIFRGFGWIFIMIFQIFYKQTRKFT